MGGWGPSNPFAERIEKPVRKNGPPLTRVELNSELTAEVFEPDTGFRSRANNAPLPETVCTVFDVVKLHVIVGTERRCRLQGKTVKSKAHGFSTCNKQQYFVNNNIFFVLKLGENVSTIGDTMFGPL